MDHKFQLTLPNIVQKSAHFLLADKFKDMVFSSYFLLKIAQKTSIYLEGSFKGRVNSNWHL